MMDELERREYNAAMKIVPLLFVLPVTILLLSTPGCAVDADQDQISGIENQRGAGLGKADHNGSCTDSCGGQSSTGACWCDELCESYGDCCVDYRPLCDNKGCDGLSEAECNATDGCYYFGTNYGLGGAFYCGHEPLPPPPPPDDYCLGLNEAECNATAGCYYYGSNYGLGGGFYCGLD